VTAYTEAIELSQSVATVYAIEWNEHVKDILFAPRDCGTTAALEDVIESLELPSELLPLAVVDEVSVAAVALEDIGSLQAGSVYRVFLTDVPAWAQFALLDIDPLLYVSSLAEELSQRKAGLDRVLDVIGPAYQDSHLENQKRPRDFVVRPVRIACQNVIVALGAIAQDSSFDGLSAPAWQTCEVPHVATHEANRALAALTVCDAFQNGGTMEIRFDRRTQVRHNGKTTTYDKGHPEGRVPASLRRFGRTVGVTLGSDDPGSISPREARELFLAITPMPGELRDRVEDATEHRGVTPERICFLLLSQVWREIDMDFILAVTGRASSILDGGADWKDRLSRQAESEVCRGAAMAGMLYRRLNSNDAAAAGTGSSVLRVVEDRTKGIEWSVRPHSSAVTLAGMSEADSVPWTFGTSGISTLTVYPRTTATRSVMEDIRVDDAPGRKAVLIPGDAHAPEDASGVIVLRCPDRLADIDKGIEDRLLKSRISRG
jgi:hypothetical protein